MGWISEIIAGSVLYSIFGPDARNSASNEKVDDGRLHGHDLERRRYEIMPRSIKKWKWIGWIHVILGGIIWVQFSAIESDQVAAFGSPAPGIPVMEYFGGIGFWIGVVVLCIYFFLKWCWREDNKGMI